MYDHESIQQYPRLPINPTALPEARSSHQHTCWPLRKLGFTYDSLLLRPYILFTVTKTQLLRLLNNLLTLLVLLSNLMPGTCYLMTSDCRRC